MLVQPSPQLVDSACIYEGHGAPKRWVWNALVMRKLQVSFAFFHVVLEPRPRSEAVLACNGQLGIAQLELGLFDRRVRGLVEAWMKFADALQRLGIAAFAGFTQVL